MWIKKRKIILSGNTVKTVTMAGDELHTESFAKSDEAKAAWNDLFTKINKDPEYRLEVQSDNEMTVYEEE